jgi:hypothetical protein
VLLNETDFSSFFDSNEYQGPPFPVVNDLENLKRLVPDIVLKNIAIFKEGAVQHESEKVAEWLMEYMESAIITEQT